MSPRQKKTLTRISAAAVLFAAALCASETGLLATLGHAAGIRPLYLEFIAFLIPYVIAGHDVIARAFKHIGRGQVFDENFLMTVATFGAFALVFFPESEPHMAEGAAVMLFFQYGEFFQDYAVSKSRQSISDMMDIAPEFANIASEGELIQVDPYELSVGDEFIVKPGERIPLDGLVISGDSQINTAALTGESAPKHAGCGDEVISGCVNLTGTLTVRATKPFEDSTVSRILELVESAADKKARTESFITRFARYYTPAVVGIAVLLAVIPPIALGQAWADWVQRGLIFLVVSCPCALVISVPLSFFGGIGGASRAGILIKGSNYLEALAQVDTMVFDKTGTLTTGAFSVVELKAAEGFAESELLRFAAHAEAFSNHPIAQAICEAYQNSGEGKRPILDLTNVSNVEETGGHGISAIVEGRQVLAGNDKLMSLHGVRGFDETSHVASTVGSTVNLSVDGVFAGSITVADAIKPDARAALADLRSLGVRQTIMLTGDRADVAQAIATELGVDQVYAELLPQDKVEQVESLLQSRGGGSSKGKLAFVGDGINDAPVLMRADVGLAMGAIGSDAAIEAADIVLMDDKPANIACAMRIARKTMGIVRQNIVFALGVKFGVLALAAFGMANMWLAVFADVGVAVLAIMNAMRAMQISRLR
ncbi:MAG: heavy metal translocating P-type ATPase [Eggerthellaceae bacterium]|nr:heavy metal translocating P-type ATPase [Eggerthellaceae bacterium]